MDTKSPTRELLPTPKEKELPGKCTLERSPGTVLGSGRWRPNDCN